MIGTINVMQLVVLSRIGVKRYIQKTFQYYVKFANCTHSYMPITLVVNTMKVKQLCYPLNLHVIGSAQSGDSNLYLSGPSYSKLTMSLVKVSLKL